MSPKRILIYIFGIYFFCYIFSPLSNISHILDYNRDRFEAIAIRVFVGDESIVTVYALDKVRQENTTLHPDKIPVKKFKLENIPLHELLTYCQGFNCTLSTQNFPLDAMEVINQ